MVAAQLTEWGIPVVRGLGVTGVVGIIKNGSPIAPIGLRADMDALPMQELNTFEHTHRATPARCTPAATTATRRCCSGAAHHLAQHRNFDGTVYLIFQPAEEGGGGARGMMEDGLFEKFPMEAVYGMHNWPGLTAGQFALVGADDGVE